MIEWLSTPNFASHLKNAYNCIHLTPHEVMREP